MTVPEFIAELEHWKREARLYKEQMEVNNDYCQRYKTALLTISKMCGYDATTNYHYCPEEVEELAIRLVQELLNKKDTP